MRKRSVIISISISIMLFVTTLILLFANGLLWFNNPNTDKYPVRGVDVSSYQGEIDWGVLSRQNISFAFIKATEGSSFVDPKLEYNLNEAAKTSLVIGAYHFFSYDSSEELQAENFISAVTVKSDFMPPVVDIEFYGIYKKQPLSKDDVVPKLKTLLVRLEKHYGKKPIIYATMKAFNLYLYDDFTDYPIWIRNVLRTPKLPGHDRWTFWQYSHKGLLEGYNGQERFIDLNVFHGSKEEFEKFLLQHE